MPQIVPSRSNIELPLSLEVVELFGNKELNLHQWLSALAALPRCHSLDLSECDGSYVAGQCDAKAARFDTMIVQSGLAVSPALKLLLSGHGVLPMLASERAGCGPPLVRVPHKSDAGELFSYSSMVFCDLEAPNVQFEKCRLLPEPHIDFTPSSAAIQNCVYRKNSGWPGLV